MEMRLEQRELEQRILGALLIPQHKEAPIAMADLKPEYFQIGSHRLIFKTIQKLFDRRQQADIVSVTEELIAMNKLDMAGGRAYITELIVDTSWMNESLSASWVGYLIDRYKHLEMQKLVYKIGDSLEQEPESDSVLTMIRDELSKLETLKKADLPSHVGASKDDILSHIDHARELGGLPGIASGYIDLDNALNGGFKPEQFIIICGRPGMCKTTVMLNFAYNMAAISKKRILVYSLEASHANTTMKLCAKISKVPYQKIEHGALDDEQLERVKQALTDLQALELYICDEPLLSIHKIQSHLEMAKRRGQPYDAVFIDYLQLMQTRKRKDDNRNLEISEISRHLKLLSMSEKITIFALAQLNRNLEMRANKRPIAADLRDSGSLEQDADLILGVYREEVYDKYTTKKGELELLMLKNRHGEMKDTLLRFNNDRCAIYSSIGVNY